MPTDLLEKVAAARAEQRVLASVQGRLRRLAQGGVGLARGSARRVRLHCPPYVSPPADEVEVVTRIFDAFCRMKEAQASAPEVYRPTSLWQVQLERSYRPLSEGAAERDLGRFHRFLANFGVWEEYTGIEEGQLVRRSMRTPLGRAYLARVFEVLAHLWNHHYGGREPFAALARPAHGNLAGAWIDDVLVTVDSFFSEIYGRLIAGMVGDVGRPVIVELGGGSGRLAYYATRDLAQSTYVDFDLPETLAVAAYYLMLAYPKKRALLYGEAPYEPAAAHERYELVFMPPFEIEKLASGRADIFVNETSLGEMSAEAVANYIRHVARAAPRYIFHMNHDRNRNLYADGDRSLLSCEYPIPSDRYKLLFRYPELKHLLYGGAIDYASDTGLWLYEKTVA